MALLVWLTTGIAIWHFTVVVPDRFWGGIAGAFLGGSLGALASGAVIQAALGRSIGETDLVTVQAAVPGSLLGLAAIYALGVRLEKREA